MRCKVFMRDLVAQSSWVDIYTYADKTVKTHLLKNLETFLKHLLIHSGEFDQAILEHIFQEHQKGQQALKKQEELKENKVVVARAGMSETRGQLKFGMFENVDNLPSFYILGETPAALARIAVERAVAAFSDAKKSAENLEDELNKQLKIVQNIVVDTSSEYLEGRDPKEQKKLAVKRMSELVNNLIQHSSYSQSTKHNDQIKFLIVIELMMVIELAMINMITSINTASMATNRRLTGLL
uniref:Uncharacterized protein n=1 Tax=Ditylenchus dipsaci TaxID=166011 RepID=A0A915DLU8_9BILA